jgi:hypothetical protein
MSDSPEISTEYYASLGRFVNSFAFTEGMVFMFLSMMTTLTKAEAAALLSGSKIDGCCGLIKRLFEARGQTIPGEISRCLEQIAVINSFRNDILHWGIDTTGKTKNSVKTMPGREQEYKVPEIALVNATLDLTAISEILAYFHLPMLAPVGKHLAALLHPWKYKPAPRDNTRQQTRSTSQKPKRPQKSSRKKP